LLIFFLCGPVNALYAQEQDRIELGISDVTKLALENNFDILIYRLDRRISEKELLKAESVYDTNLDAYYEYDEDRLNKNSVALGTRTTTVAQQGSLSKKLPTGTVLSLDIDHSRRVTDSTSYNINPYHESAAAVSIMQPLARNFLGIIDRNTIKITGLDVENTGYTSLDKIEYELAGSQEAYWKLVLAYKDLELTEDMLENTRDLFIANKRKFDMGMVELPEFYAVEADLNQKENDLLFANDKLNSALNLLRLKLNLDKDIIIDPVDDFECRKITAKFEDVITTALNNRRDYKADKNTVKSMDLYLEIKRSSMWPQIDLKGTFKKNGLNRKFNDSIREITSKDRPEYIAEVVFSFPLENSQARAEYSQKELEKARALVALKKTECLIFVQVNDAFVHAKRMYDSVRLLKKAAELEHKKYIGEEERFNRGRSDTDRLLRYQKDFFIAELTYLRSLYNYKEAIINLNVVMNNLLKTDEDKL
jgi:outer membrane protein TolC